LVRREIKMAIMEVNVIPLGTETPSVGDYVTRAVKVLKEAGVKYEVTSMSTIIEGELDDLFRLGKMMHLATFGKDVNRVVTTLKIDDRRDQKVTMNEKIKKVKRRL